MSSFGSCFEGLSAISQSETSSEGQPSPATPPRSIAPTPCYDSQVDIAPDPTYMTDNDSLGVSPCQVYEYHGHSHASTWELRQASVIPMQAASQGSVDHYVKQGQYPHLPASLSRIVTPHLSRSMRAAQKKKWDVRFSPEPSPYDSSPAARDPSVASLMIACNQFSDDIVHIFSKDEGPITVADVYAALYEALLGEVTEEHELYSQRTASERVEIQEVTARRLGDPSAKMRQWKGQLRDILGKYCILNRIDADHKTGKWVLEFVEAAY